MANLPRQILAEKENVEMALGNLRDAMATTKKSVIELSAMATFIHNIYNGIENILKQVLNLTFRHFFIYAYAFRLEEKKIADLANNIPLVWAQFLREVDKSLGER